MAHPSSNPYVCCEQKMVSPSVVHNTCLCRIFNILHESNLLFHFYFFNLHCKKTSLSAFSFFILMFLFFAIMTPLIVSFCSHYFCSYYFLFSHLFIFCFVLWTLMITRFVTILTTLSAPLFISFIVG